MRTCNSFINKYALEGYSLKTMAFALSYSSSFMHSTARSNYTNPTPKMILTNIACIVPIIKTWESNLKSCLVNELILSTFNF